MQQRAPRPGPRRLPPNPPDLFVYCPSRTGQDLKAIRSTIDQAKGGWKTVVVAAGLAGTVGALIGKFGFFIKP